MRRVMQEPFPDPAISDAVAFGRAVRAARTAAGISLQAAAEALGISKATLSDLEGGSGTVALGTAIRVARDLGAAVFVSPRGAAFDATVALRSLRSARPEPWGGLEPERAKPAPRRSSTQAP